MKNVSLEFVGKIRVDVLDLGIIIMVFKFKIESMIQNWFIKERIQMEKKNQEFMVEFWLMFLIMGERKIFFFLFRNIIK